VKHGRSKPHAFQRARPIVLDQNLGALDEIEQQFLALRFAQIERQTQLVAGVGLPEQGMAFDAPGAQGVTLVRILDLDHLGAKIGQLQRHHVAGDETRQVEHRDAVEGARCGWSKRRHCDFLRRFAPTGSWPAVGQRLAGR
jgi:hypothetical protein